MDWSKYLFGIYAVALCGIVPVWSEHEKSVMINLAWSNGTNLNQDDIGMIHISEADRDNSLAEILRARLDSHGIMINAEVPTAGNDERGYFVVGFLSPVDGMTGHGPFPTRTECYANSYSYGYMTSIYIPAIGKADDILQSPKYLEGHIYESDIYDVIRGKNRKHCGPFRLVIMIDPTHEFMNDTDFCDNYFTIDIFFDCSGGNFSEPTCELVFTGSDDADATVLYFGAENFDHGRSKKQIVKVFKNHNYGNGMYQSWEEVKPEMVAQEMQGDRRLGVMKVFQAYAKGQVMLHGANVCNFNGTNEAVSNFLDDMQGLTPYQPWAKSGEDSERDHFLEHLWTIKAFLQEGNTDQIREYASSQMQDGEFPGKQILLAIAEQAYYLLQYRPAYVMESIARDACEVSHNLEYLGHYMDEYSYRHLINLTSALAAKLMLFNPKFYSNCYENILVRLIDMNSDPSWVYEYDDGFLERLERYRNHTYDMRSTADLLRECNKKLNPCIKKLRSMCDVTNMMTGYKTNVSTLREDVCEMKIMKHAVYRHARHHRQNMAEDKDRYVTDSDVLCNGEDRMADRMGLPGKWFTIVKDTVWQVHPNMGNTGVTFQPIAQCRCKKCGGHTDTPGEGWHTGKPGEGRHTGKPGEGWHTGKPGGGWHTGKPGGGWQTGKPGGGWPTDNPYYTRHPSTHGSQGKYPQGGAKPTSEKPNYKKK